MRRNVPTEMNTIIKMAWFGSVGLDQSQVGARTGLAMMTMPPRSSWFLAVRVSRDDGGEGLTCGERPTR